MLDPNFFAVLEDPEQEELKMQDVDTIETTKIWKSD